MIALIMLLALAGYVIVSVIVVKLAPHFASTDKGKKGARIVALILVLWFPLLEPLGSFLIFQTYGLLLARATVRETAQDVDRIFIGSNNIDSKIMMKYDPDGRGSTRRFAGYTYFEFYLDSNGHYFELDTRDIGSKKIIAKPSAKYFVEERRSKLPPFCEMETTKIMDQSGLLLGEYVEILWFGSNLGQWLAPMTHGRSHSGTYFPKQRFRNFIQTVLVPAEQSE